ncbi:thioredoxin C-1-like isoform X2 [Sitodiplosis mosellana]|uniref:thioredoxin C-1-like isoform X2 n=1 Tax=Sitodiplosis mosellana TaxID=263140 RepID=UPI002443B44A|nr:thioredoxin C-1-like isoform X2 [Sitodiplosis mosellana]XP_055319992.1 thioredoxin C-1-like isoform X2 [Sitodiplosis mosellana]
MISIITRRFAPLAMPVKIRAQHIATTTLLQKIFTVQSVEDFNEKVRKSKTPVVIDFYATWCNPCKALMPRIETVIQETNGAVDLAKVDIDELTEIADDFDVSSVPVLVVIKDGKVEKRMVGLQDTDKIRSWVQSAVK